jgi:RND superfamily putative drug exporter
VVFAAADVRRPQTQQRIKDTLAKIAKGPHVERVDSPFARGAAARQVSRDGTVAFAVVHMDGAQPIADVPKSAYDSLIATAEHARAPGLRVELGGSGIQQATQQPGGGPSEFIGFIAAAFVLAIAFGSLWATALPLFTAVLALGLGLSLTGLLAHVIDIATFSPTLATLIGLGVGIDYSLFIVSRYRQDLVEGMEPNDAIGKAIATSGSAVLFAGLTVCMALCGLYFVGIPYVAQLGYVAALFVAVTIVAALTLVPALLGALGTRINSLSVHHHHETADVHKTLSARWATETSRHPVRFTLISLVILLALAAPVFKIRLGFTDDGNLSPELTQRHAYDTLTAAFGPGDNGPLLLAIDLRGADLADAQTVTRGFSALGKMSDAIKATPGVARVSLPVPNNVPTEQNPKLPTALIMQIVATTAPNSPATARLVRDLRQNVIPHSLQGTIGDASRVYIGGQTSSLIDLTDALSSRLFIFIGLVILGAFVLLMMVFRSLFVPFKAAVMNLLSIGGAYGIIVAVFQWGWGKGLIGLSGTVPIVAFVPVMMFAVLFGLSMDYEVFLISRIKEEYERSGDSRQSVVTGLAATARVITAAALIMIAVFLSFVPNPDPTVKMIGLGMAVAVFIDATIVRMVLVPSTMELAGKANWWLPSWLERILPHIHVE